MKTFSEARALCIGLAIAVAAMPSWAFDLAELLAPLSRKSSGQARFVEERHVQGLDAPLRASGSLSFAAPDRFTRRTLEPRAETFDVAGNTVSVTRNGRTRSFTLDAAPEMAALVEAVRGTLSGDADALRRHFQPSVGGSAAHWTLELTPIEPRAAAQVQRVRIAGRGGELASVEVLLAGGDRSLMKIEPVAASASAP